MAKMTASEAREGFSEALNRVAFGKERIVLHRHGRDVAALISIEDLELLRAIEDHLDVQDAIEALKEPGSVTLKKIRTEVGL